MFTERSEQPLPPGAAWIPAVSAYLYVYLIFKVPGIRIPGLAVSALVVFAYLSGYFSGGYLTKQYAVSTYLAR